MEKYCKLCDTYKDLKDFYLHYTHGKHTIKSSHYCKDCIKKDFKNNDIEQVLKICKELDIPYIKEEWNKLNERYPNTINIGRYVSKMQLTGFMGYYFEDSIYFSELWDK